MTTIDTLLLSILNHNSISIDEIMPARDSRVLRSLAIAITSNFFITENQSRLLLKILKDHQGKIPEFSDEITGALDKPSWSRKFRQVEQIRKLYILPSIDNDFVIAVEFTFSSQIRKIVGNLNKTVTGLVQVLTGKMFHAEFTEKNIVALVEGLAGHGFQIEEKLQNHYNTIKSWSEDEMKDQFIITNIVHQNFQKAITADLGIETAIDQNIIIDRSMRYQYFTKNLEKTGENLTNVIANRDKTKLWLDRKSISLSEIIYSLIELKRLPMLIIFDTYSPANSLKNLEILAKSLEENNINNNVGIYFRLPNDDVGTQFNRIIADNKYNTQLDLTTQVVGVQSGKIPKFFLSNNWKPMSVITLDSNMRHTKTAIYSNCCDLVITHSDSKPMIEKLEKWL